MKYLASFDIDNTLIKSSSGHLSALLAAVKDVYGLETRADVINHHGMTDQEIIIKILRKFSFDEETIRSRLKKCIESMPVKYAEIVKTEDIVILEGVFDLLTRLAQNGFLLGLVTGNLEKIAWIKLKKIGIDHFFKFGGFGSDHINRADLVKIAIRRAEKKYGIGKNTQIFHFGDAPQDMIAGRSAGVAPVGVTTGIFSAAELQSAGASIILPNLNDTDGILRFLLNEAGKT
jgi:phosphoglycolate phosphatase